MKKIIKITVAFISAIAVTSIYILNNYNVIFNYYFGNKEVSVSNIIILSIIFGMIIKTVIFKKNNKDKEIEEKTSL